MPRLEHLRALSRRLLLPVIFLLAVLLVASNAFLLLIRPAPSREDGRLAPREQSQPHPPQAFGAIVRPQAAASKFHQLAVPGTYAYTLADGLLPTLPSAMTLYRDQGLLLDDDILSRLFAGAGSMPRTMQMLPLSMEFETPDGTRTVSLNIARREAVIRLPQTSMETDPKGDLRPDDQVISAAAGFALAAGIDAASYDAPSVVRGSGSATTSKIPAGYAEVRWPLKLGPYPVLDQYGKPAFGMIALVNARSGRAVQLTVRLFSPESLAASEYPSAPAVSISSSLLAGGLTPIRSSAGKKFEIPISSASLAYVLWESDATHPSYLIPAVVASADVALNCKGCQPWHWVTYVPALDPATFSWTAESGSGLVK